MLPKVGSARGNSVHNPFSMPKDKEIFKTNKIERA